MAGFVCGLMLLAGCATGSPHDATAKVRSELMEVEPERAAPGEILAVHFPQETERGIAFVLEEETADGWNLRYFLVAGDEAGGAADWWTPADAEGRGWDDIGIGGSGPDFVEVPDTASPGSYRLCTANAGRNFCAPVDVVE